jgi:hypothetical protein
MTASAFEYLVSKYRLQHIQNSRFWPCKIG